MTVDQKDDELHIIAEDGVCVFNIVEMIKALQWEDTPSNRNAICRRFIADIRRESPHAKIVAVQGGGRQN